MIEQNVIEKIVEKYGGTQSGETCMVCCPCHDDNDPSLSVRVGDNGRLRLKCFAGCDRDKIEDIFKSEGFWPHGYATADDDDLDFEVDQHREIWTNSVPFTDPKANPLRLYLKNRGLKSIVPESVIRLHPSLGYYEGKSYACDFPTMIAKVTDVDGQCIGIHRTYLTDKGTKCDEKVPKKSMGSIKTGAIRIGVATETVALTEGIETAFAVTEATGLPVYSAISASGLESVELAPDIQTVHIFADKDRSGTGQNAADKAAQRFIVEGRTVFIHTPTASIPEGAKGIDWLDVFNSEGTDPFAKSLTSVKPEVAKSTTSRKSKEKNEWPEPLSKEAFHGIAGDFVKTIEPHTESDSAALLVQFLAAFGNVVGRNSYYLVEATKHYTKLFIMLVGISSKGRKGTSWDHIQSLFEGLELFWVKNRIGSGLSSGEGLIHEVRDPVEVDKIEKGKTVTKVIDKGASDKRFFVIQSEFGSTLRVMSRDGNTLSAILRDAWDKGNLRTLTRTNPLQATGSHISVIGHITNAELHRYLSETESANGFANRFLWVCIRRSKELPEGGDLSAIDLTAIKGSLSGAIRFAKAAERIKFNATTRKMWHRVYGALSKSHAGLFGAITARSEAQVIRLACIYALLDCSNIILPDHLLAALAVWEYCERSCRYIFGESTGDPDADALLKALRASRVGMTRTEIRDFFSKNKRASDIERLLGVLDSQGLAIKQTEIADGGFRKIERWCAV